jgi:predicted XRE-type DNA-binding protein
MSKKSLLSEIKKHHLRTGKLPSEIGLGYEESTFLDDDFIEYEGHKIPLIKRDVVKDVKVALVNKDMSQKELADYLGITRQYLNNILNKQCFSKKMMYILEGWLYENYHN